MIHRSLALYNLVLVLGCALLGAGCDKSSSPGPAASATPSSVSTSPGWTNAVLRLHWLGKKKLATESNSANIMTIWNLPESARLEAQTLNKLATAPWRFWVTNVVLADAAISQLRPLLDDLVQEEVYVEARGDANNSGEFVLAVRLPSERMTLWQTNLPVVLQSLLGGAKSTETEKSQESAFLSSFTIHYSFAQFSLVRAGGWSLFSVNTHTSANQNNSPQAAQSLDLLTTMRQRLATAGVPFVPAATNYLLDVEFEPARFGAAFDVKCPQQITAISLVAFSDGEDLKIRGGLAFHEALDLPLEPWSVPSNHITQPLTSFSALRGMRPHLESLKFWQEQKLGAAPNQIYFWSQGAAPWLHFFATHSPNATGQFLALKDFILDWVNPELAPNRTGDFGWETNDWRVVWTGVPFCSPAFWRAGDLISGGFVSNPTPGKPMPVEFINQLTSDPKLIYYDWEATGPEVSSWVQISQLMRMAFSRAQLSITNAGLPWLQVLHTNLGYCATSVSLAGDRQLVFARSATMGLSSVELQLLADWIDSPNFPLGIYTFTAPREFISNRMRPSR